ncbi:MAG: hypothetical protein K5871_07770 [Lachnospiraceae bacterium]|nr:hypothetical protein [Lachnospiraceae bacterium]
MAKTVVLILFLVIVAFFSGRTLMLASGLVSGKKADFFSSFSLGALVIICISFASHFVTVMGSSLLSDEKRLCGIIMVAFMSVSYFAFVILTLITGSRKVDSGEMKNVLADEKKTDVKMTEEDASVESTHEESDTGMKLSENKNSSTWIFFSLAVILSFICFVTIVWGVRTNSIGDETLETVVNFLDKGEMYGTDPLTGMPYREGIPNKQKILCIPGMYAVMCEAFGTPPRLLLESLMSGFWFLSGLFAFVALSGVLFKGRKDELFVRSAFVSCAILFVYASDLSLYSQGFAVFSAMWSPNAIRIWLLVPVLLFLLMDRKYVLAFLPVMCEVFICRTTYGIGFLPFIYAGWVIVCLAGRRLACSKAS